MAPKYVVVFIWAAWAVSWVGATNLLPGGHIAKTAGWRREWLYRLLVSSGFILLFASLGQASSPVPLPPLRDAILNFGFAQLWETPDAVGWGAAVVTAIGFAFALWARVQIGGLWTGHVAVVDGHKVIDSGPYAFVRHPIYTGLLLGAMGLLAISGRMFGVIGFVLLVIGLILKARLEERFLREELGAEVYGAYAKRVPMLVPGSPV
jgi:protein-S-isoprenylcysteine O-methyltransferase Ste14